mgnify:CR=1 FL=1
MAAPSGHPRLPDPRNYNDRAPDLALRIPPSCRDDQIDMVYFSPALS